MKSYQECLTYFQQSSGMPGAWICKKTGGIRPNTWPKEYLESIAWAQCDSVLIVPLKNNKIGNYADGPFYERINGYYFPLQIYDRNRL